MDISSVKTPPARSASPPKSATETQEAKNRTAKPKEPESHKTPVVKPNPVVNTQGQTTGRLLNVTA